MAQVKEQIKATKSRTVMKRYQPITWRIQNTGNQMFTETVEYGHKIEEKVKAVQSEIKENVQGTNNDGKETGTQISDLELKEEINIQLEQNEETRIQKNEERLRNLWENFKCYNIQIIVVPQEKNNSKKLKTYLKK